MRRKRVDARDVLDPNGRTARPFRGEIIGHYRPTGPNPWDDYELVESLDGPIEVLPGLKIQLEKHSPEFRMRSHGRVIQVRWHPQGEEADLLKGQPGAELRKHFLSHYLLPFGEAQGLGATSVLASKLR